MRQNPAETEGHAYIRIYNKTWKRGSVPQVNEGRASDRVGAEGGGGIVYKSHMHAHTPFMISFKIADSFMICALYLSLLLILFDCGHGSP